MITIATLCLALASLWRAVSVIADVQRIRRVDTHQRMYRPGRGWTTPHELEPRRRAAQVGLGAAVGLVLSTITSTSTVTAAAVILCCGGIIAWLSYERTLHRARYTSVCISILASALLLYQAARLFTHSSAAYLAGMFASFFASQLYLVAGLRKLQSAQFLSGRVIVDNLAYGLYQAAAGNREFIRFASLHQLADLLSSKKFLSACRLAALLTAAVELTIGLGVLGLLPDLLVFGLAIPSHLAFIIVSPYRVAPFTIAALGLITMAMSHPLLAAIF
jgi:hypothetical protein